MEIKIILWIGLSILVGFFWKNRGLSFLSGLIWSLVLSPILGFVIGFIVYFVKRNKSK